MASSKITVPVNRARRALAAVIAWSAGDARRTATVRTVRHGAIATGPAALDLALALALIEAEAEARTRAEAETRAGSEGRAGAGAGAGARARGTRPAEVAAAVPAAAPRHAARQRRARAVRG